MSWTENKWLKPAWMGGNNDFVTKYQDKFSQIGEKFAPKVKAKMKKAGTSDFKVLEQKIRWFDNRTVMFAEFKIKGMAKAKADSLQIIQIVFASLEEQIEGYTEYEPGGPGEIISPPNSKDYITDEHTMIHPKTLKERHDDGYLYWKYVDAGRYSPRAMTDGHETVEGKPYYLSEETLLYSTADFEETGEQKAYYEITDDNDSDIQIIRTSDNPDGINGHRFLTFETILVATEYNNTSKDKLIGSFVWKFQDGGRFISIDNTLQMGVISDEALKVLKNDYPLYQLIK